MTTGGEGGMLVTNDEALWQRAWAFKDHGKSHNAVYNREHAPGFRWLHESFGTNWRLTEIQSAIGRIQLRKLDGWIAQRRSHALELNNCFEKITALRVTRPPNEIGHAYYKYYVFVQPEKLADGWNRDRIVAEINADGVPCYSGSCSEIYLERAFEGSGWQPAERLKYAVELGETSLMFLVHPTLNNEAISATCGAVMKVMATASA